MKKSTYITITILLSLIILPALWGYSRATTKISTTASKGLVGHWALDNITGAQDKTPYGNHGTGAGGIAIGGATDQHGQANRATSFVGASSQNITASVVNMSANQAKSFTVWIKTATGNRAIVRAATTSSPIYIYIETNGNLSSWLGNTGYTFGGTLTDNIWHHIVWVYTGTQELGYIDGVQVGSANTESASALSDNIVLGSTANFFNGSMADAHLYNRALSQAEVTSLYSSYRPIQAISSLSKGLVGAWDLSQTSLIGTNTMADKTPYANNLTLVDTPTSATDRHGQSGKALTFNGSSQYAWKSIADFRSGDSQGTVSAWIKPAAIGTASLIFSSADEATTQYYFLPLRLDITGVISVQQQNIDPYDLILGSTLMANGIWYHVAVVSNGSTYSLYVNGIAESLTVSSGANTGDWFADTSNRDSFTIGVLKRTSLGGYFNGSIENVKVYDRALSAAEVLSEYNSYNPIRKISSLYKGLIIDMPLAQQDLIGTTTIANKTPYSLYNGTLGGGITVGGQNDRHGQANKATDFDGSDDNINLGDVTQLNSVSAFTIATWLNQDILDQTDFVFNKSDGTGNNRISFFQTSSDGNAYFEINSGGVKRGYFDYSTVISAGVWAHVVMVYDGTQSTNATRLKVYVNGAQQTLTFAGTIPATTANLAGYNAHIGTSSFDGKLSNFKLWNRALSAGEVASLYNSYK